MKNKFDIGEVVKYWDYDTTKFIEGEVRYIRNINDAYQYFISSKHKLLWIEEKDVAKMSCAFNRHLVNTSFNKNVNTETHCPVCQNKWHVDAYHKEWKDCINCNKKAEDILEEISKNSKLSFEEVMKKAMDADFDFGQFGF